MRHTNVNVEVSNHPNLIIKYLYPPSIKNPSEKIPSKRWEQAVQIEEHRIITKFFIATIKGYYPFIDSLKHY